MRPLGKRASILLLLAGVFFLIGVKALFDPQDDESRFFIYTMIPSWGRAVLWCGSATIAIFAALKPGTKDGFGFVALSIPATIISFSYLFSTVGFFFGVTDYGLGWANSLSWLLTLGVIYIVSSWREDPAVQEERDEENARGS